MMNSVELKHKLSDGEDPWVFERELPEEFFHLEYGFDGHDIGPFSTTFVEGKRESRKNIEPLTLTLFWIPKTSIAAEELCQLIADHGYKATRHYIPNKPKARGPFTASD